jgi:hypothetical protein
MLKRSYSWRVTDEAISPGNKSELDDSSSEL